MSTRYGKGDGAGNGSGSGNMGVVHHGSRGGGGGDGGGGGGVASLSSASTGAMLFRAHQQRRNGGGDSRGGGSVVSLGGSGSSAGSLTGSGNNLSALNKVKFVSRKIAVLGYRTVGKTALTTHFVQERFVEHYDPTIENTFHKTVAFPRLHIFAEIVDSAGMDEYSRLSRNASVGVHGYLLLYAVNSRNSFEKIKRIDELLVDMHGGGADSVARVLVGTMIDADGRQVSYDEGLAWADRRGIPFVECSARENVNVREVFTTLLREAERDTMLHDMASYGTVWGGMGALGIDDCECMAQVPPCLPSGWACGGGGGGGGGGDSRNSSPAPLSGRRRASTSSSNGKGGDGGAGGDGSCCGGSGGAGGGGVGMFGCVPCVADGGLFGFFPWCGGGNLGGGGGGGGGGGEKGKSPTPSLGYDYDDGDLGSQQEPGPDEFMPGRQNSTMMARMAQGTLRGGANNNRGVGNGSGSGSGGGGAGGSHLAHSNGTSPLSPRYRRTSSSDYANDW